MSIYPCDIHGQRVRGSLEAVYASLLRGQLRYSRRLRVCPNDLDELLSAHQREWLCLSDDDSIDLGPVCGACGQRFEEASDLQPLFITVYRRGQDREDYFARYCETCAADLANVLGLALVA